MIAGVDPPARPTATHVLADAQVIPVSQVLPAGIAWRLQVGAPDGACGVAVGVAVGAPLVCVEGVEPQPVVASAQAIPRTPTRPTHMGRHHGPPASPWGASSWS